jgi:hypothetical protein
MSQMKYVGLLLLLVALALAMAAPVFAEETAFFTESMDEDPGWTLTGLWAYGTPTGVAGDPTGGQDGAECYAHNLFGAYPNGLATAQTLTTTAIDCSGKYSVKLTFYRLLNAFAEDRATLSVSNNGTTWNKVWDNTDADGEGVAVADGAYTQVSYDISDYADGQATVYIRWSQASDAEDATGGWNIDNVVLTYNGPDTAYAEDMSADPGWTLEANWEYGAAAAGGGQAGVGEDPADDADGVAGGGIVGYDIGANYGNDMAWPMWATAGPFDFTDKVDVELRFSRFLSVEDARWDHAYLQVTNDTSEQEVFSDDTEVTLTGEEEQVYAVDTTDLYDVTFDVTVTTADFDGDDEMLIEWSDDAGENWTTVATITTDVTDQVVASGVLTWWADNNPDFQIRGVMNSDPGTGTITLVEVGGYQWFTIYENPGTEAPASPENTIDEEWTDVAYDISGYADGMDAVYVRWGMGPSDDWANSEFGGWSIDNFALVTGAAAWKDTLVDVPDGMIWEASAGVTVGAKNQGTASWDDSYLLEEVISDNTAIERWGVGSVESGAAAPGATNNFTADITSPPLTTMEYDPATLPTGPAAVSALECNWDMSGPLGWVDGVPAVDDIAEGEVVISRFSDVLPGTDGAWARFDIEQIAGRVPKIIVGFADKTYRPKMQLDRAALAVYIASAAELTLSDTLAGTFRDVSDDPDSEYYTWAWKEIEACELAGIISGYAGGTYRPLNKVARDAMAKFIANGAGLAVVDVTEKTFEDVEVEGDDQNVFYKEIAAVQAAGIVVGFPNPDPEADLRLYKPAQIITRDQLAPYIYKGFMRDNAVPVLLGGPAITAVDLSTATEQGWPSESMAMVDDENDAYAVFDAVRMQSGLAYVGPTWDVRFELRDADEPTTAIHTMTANVPTATVNAEVAAAVASGVPYFDVYVDIPTGLQGDWQMWTLVEDAAGNFDTAARKVKYQIIGDVFSEDFEAGSIAGWTYTGLPSGGPDIDDWDSADPVEDFTNGNFSGMLVGTQAMAINIDTTNHKHLTLMLALGAKDLEGEDVVTVDWSPDSGAHWYTVLTIDADTVNDDGDPALNDFELSLPDMLGEDPGAAENPNFMLRIGITASSELEDFAYVDDILITGT